MHGSNERFSLGLRILLSILIGFWFWQFFPLMANLKLIIDPKSFILVLIVLVILQWIPVKPIRVVGALLVTVWYMAYYFAPHGASVVVAVRDVLRSEWTLMPDLFTGRIPPDPLQTHLFLLIVVVLFWFVAYASKRPRLWSLYNVLGVLVLLLVDGNTAVHPSGAIVWLLFIGTIVLALLQFHTLIPNKVTRSVLRMRFYTPFFILLVVISGVAFALPKQAAMWANPFLALGVGGDGSGGNPAVHMIGYQLDDSRLGGSFIQNHTPVLAVISNQPTYLRGQVLTEYTGKGWEAANYGAIPNNFANVYVGKAIPQVKYWDYYNLPTQSMQQTVKLLSNNVSTLDLLGGWAISQVTSLHNVNSTNNPLTLNSATGDIAAPPLTKGESYSLEVTQPVDPYQTLSALTTPFSKYRSRFLYGKQAKYIREYLLQLPPNLPARVGALARQIVQGSTTEYQMVMAVESYLQENYTYDAKNIPVPGPGQDYVDQFLFESKKGYCNNFSSAMAVMLRTLDIPTRWVTGFNVGDVDPNYHGPGNRYILEESNAHSWVEVAFPGYGWIPFDPTPNFDIPFPTSSTPTQPSTTTPSSSNGNGVTHPKKTKIPPVIPGGGSNGGTSYMFEWRGFIGTALWTIGWLIVGGGILVFLLHRQLREKKHQWLWKSERGAQFVRPMRYLIKQLRRFGVVPQSAVTLRDLESVAKRYGIDQSEYQHLVKTVEGVWYGQKETSHPQAKQLRAIWLRWLRNLFGGK